MTQPITVRFDGPDDAIILWDVRGTWHWQHWNQAVKCSVELRQSVVEKPLVPVVLDMSHSGPLPMGLLAHARNGMDNMDRRDFVIVAGGSGFMQSFVRSFRLLNPSYADKVLLAPTRADAYAMIARCKRD